MQEILLIVECLILSLIIGAFLFRKYLFSYLAKKGENLATKEDIAGITSKIEEVKLNYATQLESTKAELSSQINNHGFRYEKEYEVLDALTNCLVDVKTASLNLRPTFDYIDSNKSSDEVKRERLGVFYDARCELLSIREKKRPFYSADIYDAILEIDNVANTESLEYKYGDKFDGDKLDDYWENAEKNQTLISDKTEEAMKKIRDRVNKWELLDKKQTRC